MFGGDSADIFTVKILLVSMGRQAEGLECGSKDPHHIQSFRMLGQFSINFILSSCKELLWVIIVGLSVGYWKKVSTSWAEQNHTQDFL